MFRKLEPTKTGSAGQYAKYSDYKGVLMKDFNGNCGYCNDNHSYTGGWRGMQIDHFAPRTPFNELEHDYDNLVYSCFYCNNAKSNDWVTDVAENSISDDGNSGYIHPREKEYANLFERSAKGSIVPRNKLGFYIYTNLNLGLLRHEIIHTMEKIFEVVKKINKVLKENNISSEISNLLKENRDKLLYKRFALEVQFREIINAR
jgi:uncharacterized protein (TIGR02646 family)